MPARTRIKIGDKWGEWQFDGELLVLQRHARNRMWYAVKDAEDDARAFDMLRHFHSKAWVTDKIIADFVRAVVAFRRQAFRDHLVA